MDTSAEDFRRHFSSLSDAALLETNREDLAETAKLCFDEEVASRGLDREPEPNESAEEPIDAGQQLVSIAKFNQQDEANFARNLLETNGIPSSFASAPGSGEICCLDLMVAPEFAEDARLVLETPISDEELAAQAEAEDEPQ